MFFIATTIESKIGFGIFLLLTGLGILLKPKTQAIEISIQNIVGLILISIATLLFIWRIDELRNEKNQNK